MLSTYHTKKEYMHLSRVYLQPHILTSSKTFENIQNPFLPDAYKYSIQKTFQILQPEISYSFIQFWFKFKILNEKSHLGVIRNHQDIIFLLVYSFLCVNTWKGLCPYLIYKVHMLLWLATSPNYVELQHRHNKLKV